MLRVLAVLVLVAALAVGCRSSGSTTVTVTNSAGSAAQTTVSESPGDFAKRILGYAFTGQWGREWDELHPGHQAIVDRDTYQGCMQDQDSVEVREVVASA